MMEEKCGGANKKMYDGKMTPRLLRLIQDHEDKFGYDPCSEIELEYGKDYRSFVRDVKKAIKINKSISDMIFGNDNNEW